MNVLFTLLVSIMLVSLNALANVDMRCEADIPRDPANCTSERFVITLTAPGGFRVDDNQINCWNSPLDGHYRGVYFERNRGDGVQVLELTRSPESNQRGVLGFLFLNEGNLEVTFLRINDQFSSEGIKHQKIDLKCISTW